VCTQSAWTCSRLVGIGSDFTYVCLPLEKTVCAIGSLAQTMVHGSHAVRYPGTIVNTDSLRMARTRRCGCTGIASIGWRGNQWSYRQNHSQRCAAHADRSTALTDGTRAISGAD